MSEAPTDPERPNKNQSPPKPRANADAVLCERCSAEMFRMHAVWRCPSCGYKTDCCGW
jgi:rubrerythrin